MPTATPHTVDTMPAASNKKDRETAQLFVKGKAIRCPMCNHEWFWEKKVQLNRRGMAIGALE